MRVHCIAELSCRWTRSSSKCPSLMVWLLRTPLPPVAPCVCTAGLSNTVLRTVTVLLPALWRLHGWSCGACALPKHFWGADVLAWLLLLNRSMLLVGRGQNREPHPVRTPVSLLCLPCLAGLAYLLYKHASLRRAQPDRRHPGCPTTTSTLERAMASAPVLLVLAVQSHWQRLAIHGSPETAVCRPNRIQLVDQ